MLKIIDRSHETFIYRRMKPLFNKYFLHVNINCLPLLVYFKPDVYIQPRASSKIMMQLNTAKPLNHFPVKAKFSSSSILRLIDCNFLFFFAFPTILLSRHSIQYHISYFLSFIFPYITILYFYGDKLLWMTLCSGKKIFSFQIKKK